MGEVYEAEDTETGRRVALKVLSQTLGDPADRARFLREGRLAASISHPNSVYVYGTAEIDGTPVISMEFVPSGTLKDRIVEKGPMPTSEAVDAILQVIDGLEAAAAVGVLHRDIKPSNCFLDRDGTVKVGDFGLSISTLSRAESHLTATGTFLGTPSFASPEQVRCEELDVRSDIYSVGATLYYLLTGRAPFEEGRMGKLIAAVLERDPEPLRRLRPDVPRGLERVIQRCLAKDPAARFGRYATLRRNLRPNSSTAPQPAALGLRFVAGMIDSLVLGLGAIAVAVYRGGSGALSDSSVSLRAELFGHGAQLMYFTVLEGLWGASLGKAICGLRVVGPARSVPGLQRAFLRALVWLSLPFLPIFVYLVVHSNEKVSSRDTAVLVIIFCSFALKILLFATARRANGFAAVHDLVSRTRVVFRSLQVTGPILHAHEEAVPHGQRPVRVGPYSIVATLSERAGEKLLLAYDDQLRRRTWVHILPPGSPALSAVRRDLGRPCRLRWLNGRRSAGDCWDAYETPDGRTLRDMREHQHPWSSVRYWLLGLAGEIGAGFRDGSAPPSLDLDRVWITPDGRVKLLDFPAPVEGRRDDRPAGSSTSSFPLASAQAFLYQVAVFALEKPIPLHARSFLDDLRRGTFPSLESLVERLNSLIHRPPAVSRRQRLIQVWFSSFVPLFAAAVVAFVTLLQLKWAAEHRKFDLFFVTLNRLGECQSQMAEGSGDSDLMRERRLLQLSAASQYRQLKSDFALWSNRLAFVRPERLRRIAEQAAARYPIFSSEELADAEKELKPFLDRATRNALRNRLAMPLWIGTFLFFLASFVALVSALLVRGGLHLRLVGAAVVTEDGSEASRLHAFWRAVVAWSPWLLLLFLVTLLANKHLAITLGPGHPIFYEAGRLAGRLFAALVMQERPGGVGQASSAIGAILAAWIIFLAGALWAVLHPDRGLQDRIAGTYLVPR